VIPILAGVGEFLVWFLWPDTYACILIKRAFQACPQEERDSSFQAMSLCDNVVELEQTVESLEVHWARMRKPEARVAETIFAPKQK
jgi:hypothetical protein